MSKSAIQRRTRLLPRVAALALIAVATTVLCLIFYRIQGIASACTVGLIGVFCAAVIAYSCRRPTVGCLMELAATLALGTLFIALLLPALQAPRPPGQRRRVECANNLKQIVLGMHHYHDSFKSLPSAYIPDSQGNGLHSWRVLLLPFMEQAELHRQYDFNSAWNSDTNLPLAALCPRFYRCPLGADPASDTNYLAVVGSETAWPGSEPLLFHDVLDGTSNTIAIVESHQTEIKWTEPRDLAFRDAPWRIRGDTQRSEISSQHTGGAYAALLDGSIRFIPETMDQEVLRALITAQGGEPMADSW